MQLRHEDGESRYKSSYFNSNLIGPEIEEAVGDLLVLNSDPERPHRWVLRRREHGSCDRYRGNVGDTRYQIPVQIVAKAAGIERYAARVLECARSHGVGFHVHARGGRVKAIGSTGLPGARKSYPLKVPADELKFLSFTVQFNKKLGWVSECLDEK